MPTVLVIDDDPIVASSVRSAVRSWTVLEAYDGASGIALVRAQRPILDLVVLDVRMPHHDGVLVCIQIRTEYPDLPVQPMTAAVEAVPTLSGLGCSPPLLKPVPLDILANALRRAIGMQPPPLVAEPLLPYVQQQAAVSEHAARLHERAAPGAAIFASSELLRAGLHGQLTAAGGIVRVEAIGADILRATLAHLRVAVLVADDHVQADAVKVAEEFGLPLLIVALTLTAGYRAADIAQGVVVDPIAPDVLATALMALADGRCYRDPLLDMPIAPGTLTKTEHKILVRLLRGMRVDAIAAELTIQPDTVYQHRSHIYTKLGVTDLDEIRDRVDTQQIVRTRAGGR
jgi:DNA-binding NarL/FixJ family response regulator